MSRKKISLALGVALFVALLAHSFHVDLTKEEALALFANADSRFVEVDGMQVHYRDTGAGLPVLLLHGNSSSLHTWEAWATVMSPHRRVIRLDLPGFGLTGSDPTGRYDFARESQFVAHFLAAIHLEGPIDLVGNSQGGRVAWTFAVQNPAQVRKLVLIDSAGFPFTGGRWLLKLRSTLPVRLVANYLTPRRIVAAYLYNTYGDATKVTDALVDHYLNLQLVAGNRASMAAMSDIFDADDTLLLTQIRQPTLILWGGSDRMFPRSAGDLFAKAIPASRLIVYEGVGHIPMEEIPDVSVRDVENFLDEIAAPKPAVSAP